MTTITKERLQWLANISGRDDIDDIDGGEIRELALIALASLEAEPVAWMRDDADGREYNARNEFSGGGGGVPLYATPQVQVVPEAEPVAVNDDMAYAFHHALSDSSLGADEVEEIKAGLRAAFANVTIQPEPVVPDEIELAIENLKQKLVECNRYNYCADAVKNVEDACRAVSYSQADNQPASGNQAAESNRGNEWTGNPDIDNAIIMLDRIDTLENCDDDRIEAVKAVLRRLAGNSPVTPDGWISCSERMPEKGQNVLISVNFDSSLVEPLICSARYTGSTFRRGDVTIKPGNGIEQATHWMPLPKPPQEVNRG